LPKIRVTRDASEDVEELAVNWAPIIWGGVSCQPTCRRFLDIPVAGANNGYGLNNYLAGIYLGLEPALSLPL
jgi:hypothetical protein